MNNIWKTLGIGPTKDIKTIKEAFSKRSKEVHPEEHPNEFKDLKTAYKLALNYAKSSNYQTTDRNVEIKVKSETRVKKIDEESKKEKRAKVFLIDFDEIDGIITEKNRIDNFIEQLKQNFENRSAEDLIWIELFQGDFYKEFIKDREHTLLLLNTMLNVKLKYKVSKTILDEWDRLSNQYEKDKEIKNKIKQLKKTAKIKYEELIGHGISSTESLKFMIFMMTLIIGIVLVTFLLGLSGSSNQNKPPVTPPITVNNYNPVYYEFGKGTFEQSLENYRNQDVKNRNAILSYIVNPTLAYGEYLDNNNANVEEYAAYEAFVKLVNEGEKISIMEYVFNIESKFGEVMENMLVFFGFTIEEFQELELQYQEKKMTSIEIEELLSKRKPSEDYFILSRVLWDMKQAITKNATYESIQAECTLLGIDEDTYTLLKQINETDGNEAMSKELYKILYYFLYSEYPES